MPHTQHFAPRRQLRRRQAQTALHRRQWRNNTARHKAVRRKVEFTVLRLTSIVASVLIALTGVVLFSNSYFITPVTGVTSAHTTTTVPPVTQRTVEAPQYHEPPADAPAVSINLTAVPKDNQVPSGLTGEIPEGASGTLVAVPGSQKGSDAEKHYTYRVEYEKGLNINPEQTAHSIHMILNDPRGWGFSFDRTDGNADFRIVIASPNTTNSLCYPLRTTGTQSCRNGSNVILNAKRWANGTQMWTSLGRDINDYRIYQVNHETGHFLGHGHEFCRTSGTYAPVMQQQSSDGGNNNGCTPNGWPVLDNTR
ncbi:MAG: DUF3152 domain-containing protein [Actinomycetaceae bacterium]|nr:DUF3152 domain-containing protein [Actinomycetaceae bacterium]